MDSATVERLGFVVIGFLGSAIGGFYAIRTAIAVHAEKLATLKESVDSLRAWRHHVTDTTFPEMQREILRLKRKAGDES